jgi:hypothetical protein
MTQAPPRPAQKDDDALTVRARLEDSHFTLRVHIESFAKTECGIHA